VLVSDFDIRTWDLIKMPNSTQQSINIAGIKDGVVITKSGNYIMILQVATTNFALKSEQEQNSIIFQYQSFLNSLHFPVEIVIRSKKLDLTNYLAKIEKLAKEQTSELLRLQTLDYIDFVGKLINLANIMKKSFYAVVSYNPITVNQVGIFDKLFGSKSQIFDHIKISEQEFTGNLEKLRERANIVASGLGGMGLRCFQLGTEELIELFYEIYNPEESTHEKISDAISLASGVIQSEEEKGNVAKEVAETPIDPNAGMIDNTAIVAEKNRQEAELRAFESQRTADREVRTNPVPSAPAAPQQPTQQ
jgi:type IV secretory pathway VirB4 component